MANWTFGALMNKVKASRQDPEAWGECIASLQPSRHSVLFRVANFQISREQRALAFSLPL